MLKALEEIHLTTRDEYGLNAGGLLRALEQFSALFGLKPSHLLYSAAEIVSLTLQRKDITMQDALDAVETAKVYYKRLRSDEEFNRFYDGTVAIAEKHTIGQPQLPRYRRQPVRLDSGSAQHAYPTAKAYYRQLYFEACDLLAGALEERFSSQRISSVLAIESTLLNAANGKSFESNVEQLAESCFNDDINLSDLGRHLPILQDVIKKGAPMVKKVTSVHTICEAMNTCSVFKDMLPTVHQLLRLYLTVPLTSATSERTFSALRRVLTYVRATMTEQRLNNCMLLHVHKDLTDSLDMVAVAKEFVARFDRKKKLLIEFCNIVLCM